ncbi:MAG TPA: hypothetical protein VK459_25790 [Polyangiaceae bacterium]|nr:hypothetical protein [Polyangiaceae bacterium]
MSRLLGVGSILISLFTSGCGTAAPTDDGSNSTGGDPTGGDPTGGDPTGGEPTGGEPAMCTESKTLNGTSGETVSLPVTIDASGFRLCLHLDASLNDTGHFFATTAYVDGASSPLVLTLLEPDGTLLREGWDVTVGQSDPKTSAHLEWSMPGGEVRDAVLRVTTKAQGTEMTTLGVSLFEPLE